MDAFVMEGKTLGSGAVSAVRNIANPIQLARLVMDKVYACKYKNGQHITMYAHTKKDKRTVCATTGSICIHSTVDKTIDSVKAL